MAEPEQQTAPPPLDHNVPLRRTSSVNFFRDTYAVLSRFPSQPA